MDNPAKIFGDVTRLHFLKVHQTVSGMELGKGQPPILAYLTDNDGCIQSDIAKREHKAPATVTVMLQTMEKNGLIERRSSDDDHRTVRVYITDKGREAHEKSELALKQMDEEIYAAFTDEEREEFFRLLGKMRDRLKLLLNLEDEK